MKNFQYLFLILIISGFSLLLSAQNKNNDISADSSYVYLFDNTIVGGKNVEFVESYINEQISVDNNYYDIREVLFYQGNFGSTSGFFGISKGIRYGSPSVVKLEYEGKINLFSQAYCPSIIINGRASNTNPKKYSYFNTSKYGELQYANYKNLKPIMLDNETCMTYLNQYKTRQTIATGVKLTAAGLFVVSIVNFSRGFIAIDNVNNNPNITEEPEYYLTRFGITLGGAIIGTWIGTWITPSRGDYVRRAVLHYNNPEFEED
jgi:hypothetical protein